MRTKKVLKGKLLYTVPMVVDKNFFAEMVNLLANQVQSYLPMTVYYGFPHDSE